MIISFISLLNRRIAIAFGLNRANQMIKYISHPLNYLLLLSEHKYSINYL